MEPLEVADNAFMDCKWAPLKGASLSTKIIVVKNSYATTISSSPKSTILDARQLKDSIKAKHTTHNGILDMMFKAYDYYIIMVAEYRLMIIERKKIAEQQKIDERTIDRDNVGKNSSEKRDGQNMERENGDNTNLLTTEADKILRDIEAKNIRISRKTKQMRK
ncbi:hypothetical protein HAX54_022733 [Datura stramonium]|uniref:Uncharacterized protein n=1 Tax=Datura stramonium TaxID=4076 RepID=A0ABS8UV42_DATST|nr:hypothetical protein [Datura stramonium]